jgi:hypothetical protein
LAAAPAILLALAAHVVRLDPSFREHDPKSQYERSRRPVCVLLALFPVLMVARNVYSRGFQFQHPLIAAILFVMALVFVWLATTRSINWENGPLPVRMNKENRQICCSVISDFFMANSPLSRVELGQILTF